MGRIKQLGGSDLVLWAICLTHLHCTYKFSPKIYTRAFALILCWNFFFYTESSVLWKYALPVVGGVAAVVAAPVALAAAGFGAGGIAAGSLAAKAMSLTATTGYGAGVVGTLQAS